MRKNNDILNVIDRILVFKGGVDVHIVDDELSLIVPPALLSSLGCHFQTVGVHYSAAPITVEAA